MITLQLRGEERLMRRLKALIPKIEKRVDDAGRESAKRTQSMALASAPRRTGDLRRAIRVRRLRQRRRGTGRFGAWAVVVDGKYISSQNFYPAFVEFGTDKMNADPFLGPAAKRQRTATQRRFTRAGREGVKESTRVG